MENKKKPSLIAKYPRLIAILIVIATIIGMFLIIIPILLNIIPDLMLIFKSGDTAAAVEYLKQFGVLGLFLIFFIQILQNLSLILPAPPIWTVAGISYGVWLGSLICIIGMVVGTTLAFIIARKFGNKLVNMIIGDKKRKYLEFLDDKHKTTIALFFLFLLPIFPSPLVPYLAARSNISVRRFATTVFVANIPSVFYFALMGDQIIKGNFKITIILFVIIAIVFVIFFLFRKKIMALAEKMMSKKSN
ncbi:MAG: VTT domain-containing protein [Clostridia bacterium]